MPPPINLAREFSDYLKKEDRILRKATNPIPSQKIKDSIAHRFWSMIREFEQFEIRYPELISDDFKSELRGILGPWLYRSKYFNRSYIKPHGYPGDYKMIELMYDLQDMDCANPTQPAMINCIDYIFKSVHSVQSLWDRREYFTQLLCEEYSHANGTFRILDVACGGARYLRDFLAKLASNAAIEVVLIDQDASALNFLKTQLRPWSNRITFSKTSVHSLSTKTLSDFDVIISAGLFDYLHKDIAKSLANKLLSGLSENGVLAISNFHRMDPSRIVKDWLVDWQLIFRNESEVRDLFPADTSLKTFTCKSGALIFCEAKIS